MQSKLEKPKISGWRVGLFLDILHRGFDYSIPWDVVEDKVWKKLKRK